MIVTELIMVPPTDSGSRVVLFIDIIFDDVFMIHGGRIIDTGHGFRFYFPDRAFPNLAHKRQFKDICHPVCSKYRFYVETIIFTEYEKIKDQLPWIESIIDPGQQITELPAPDQEPNHQQS